MRTFDSFTIDSTGEFLVHELERLDQELHAPLVDFTWTRDIDLREDVTIADEASSFTNSSFASAGGIKPAGKSFVGKTTNAIARMALDIGKTANPLYLWAQEIGYTIPELLSAQQLGRPVDSQMYDGLVLKHNMDVDEMVYVGDTDLGKYGLLNSNLVTPSNVANGAAGSPLWTRKTPDEIVADVNDLLAAVYRGTGWALVPDKLLISPTAFGYLASQKVSLAGDETILGYVKRKGLCMEKNGKPLDVQPVKWAIGAGAGGTVGTEDGHDRMCAYTKDKKRVRFPLVPLQRTPLEYRSLYHITTYFGRLGVVEFVYPESVGYADGYM